ncbi:DNA topoisomerase III [Staphylococcus sp. Marseille-Q5304]|uniref:DNA topoisomerase III n=1 Tax=Staphylococcus sp. Marseille-Q5304 TaxID=2942200 RepID=UPI002072DEE7|nr:DNA topoisomerase III [Staphylococcus sp. Marseille-Q5304]
MKSLIIAEKPSVGRDIAKSLNINTKRHGFFENEKYIVTWALGHLVTNATPEQYDVQYKEWKLTDLPIVPKQMKTVVINKTRKQFSIIKGLINDNKVKDIIIATDAGREGELVARLILDKSKNKKPIKRLWISSVTSKAIKEGFKKLYDGRKFNDLYQAALARSEADWIVGINATRALTTKYDAQLSLGRVQTPTIQLVQMRQNEINQFTPETYYSLKLMVGGFEFKCVTPKSHSDKAYLEQIQTQIKGQAGEITDINRTRKKSYPSQLYSLTDLQQDAYKRFHMTPKESLNVLQNLYERHKLLTYPRTDSNYLTDDMVPTLKDRIKALFATDFKDIAKSQMNRSFSGKFKFVNNSKVSDHHAIIPTEIRPDMSQLSPRESKIYLMVAQRFLENLLPPHEYESVSVTLQTSDYKFIFNDKVTINPGYLALRDKEANAHRDLNQLQRGNTFTLNNVKIEDHETTAPSYFNEGTLLKAMESPHKYFDLQDTKHQKTLKIAGGIGTVATRADIIEKLFNMNAIESRDGKIKVTPKGKQILELAPQRLTSPLLTAEWEEKLLKIEKGQYNAQQFINEMKNFTYEVVNEIKESDQKYKHDNLTSTECPTCGKFMIKVKTKNGQMLVCQDPSCKTKKNVQRKTKAKCPNCHKRMTLFGKGKEATYRCVCGHTETQAQMDQRLKNKKTAKVNKKDLKKYMNQDDGIENNPFKDALKDLKL